MADTSREAQARHFALICMHFYPEMISTGLLMTELSVALTGPQTKITVFADTPSVKLNDEPVPAHMRYHGIDIHRVPAKGAHRGSMISRAIRGLTFSVNTLRLLASRRREFDAVIVTTNPPFLGIVSALAKKWFKLPYMLVVHDVYPDTVVRLGMIREGGIFARIWESVTRFILRNSSVIVVLGVDMAKLIEAKLPPTLHGRVVTIRNWSNDENVAPVPKAQNPFVARCGLTGNFVVQYSGTMGRVHNIEPLLDAAEIMRDDPVVFQLIGAGAKTVKLQADAQARSLTNVQFLPFQPIEDLQNVLSASDLSVVCLDPAFTGSSVPCKSYGVMAVGRPLLALMDAESEIGRTVIEEDCGWVVSDADGARVAAAIRAAMSDSVLLAAKAANSRRAFLIRFTLSKAAAAYREALERVARSS